MIDWFTGKIGYDGRELKQGVVKVIDESGAITKEFPRPVHVMGSFDSRIQMSRESTTDDMIKAASKYNLVNNYECLWIHGNPTKFMQGHNVFGPTVAALGQVVRGMVKYLPDSVRPVDAASELLPALQRNRVDVTVMIDMDRHEIVHEWLRHAEIETRSRQGRPRAYEGNMKRGSSVYWQMHSTRWTLKAYCKFCEMSVHKCKDSVMQKNLHEWVEPQLRLELALRRPELRDRGTLHEPLVYDFSKKVGVENMSKIQEVNSKILELRMGLRLVLDAWQSGKDPKQFLARATFYKYRREILDKTGIDISLPKYSEEKIKSIDLGIDELINREIKEVDIPKVLKQYQWELDLGDLVEFPAHC